MLLMRANPLRGQVGGNRDFFGPCKWHRAVRRVPLGAQKINQQETVTYGT
jgi:hypothetical protein